MSCSLSLSGPVFDYQANDSGPVDGASAMKNEVVDLHWRESGSMNRRKPALLALSIRVPAPSLGVLFGAGKLWLFGLPVVRQRFVTRGPVSLSPPKLLCAVIKGE